MAQVYDVDIEKLIHRCNKRLTKMTQDMYRSYKSINLFKTYFYYCYLKTGITF